MLCKWGRWTRHDTTNGWFAAFPATRVKHGLCKRHVVYARRTLFMHVCLVITPENGYEQNPHSVLNVSPAATLRVLAEA